MADADATVLIVDDEEDLLEMLAYPLEKEGYRVLTARDGAEGLRIAEAEHPDLIVLDIMMPHVDGIEATRRLREDARLRLTPILMLTARTAERDEIAGLDAGADDYLVKPITARLFLSRVRALLRRNEREDGTAVTPLRVHDLVVDRGRYVVGRTAPGRAEETFRLPRKEFELLHYLAAHPGRVFTREELLDAVWGTDVFVVDRTVDVHVRKIREKLGSAYIETVKGVGYKLAETLA
jgi:two-component system alkaline phosphatase synthesis response regulator PhoP